MRLSYCCQIAYALILAEPISLVWEKSLLHQSVQEVPLSQQHSRSIARLKIFMLVPWTILLVQLASVGAFASLRQCIASKVHQASTRSVHSVSVSVLARKIRMLSKMFRIQSAQYSCYHQRGQSWNGLELYHMFNAGSLWFSKSNLLLVKMKDAGGPLHMRQQRIRHRHLATLAFQGLSLPLCPLLGFFCLEDAIVRVWLVLVLWQTCCCCTG